MSSGSGFFSRASVVAIVLSAISFAGTADAASIYKCSTNGRRCIIRLESGIVGDQVKVLDEKAHIVGVGHIIKRKNAFAVIALSHVGKSLQYGFPVVVDFEARNSNLEYAAAFSHKD